MALVIPISGPSGSGGVVLGQGLVVPISGPLTEPSVVIKDHYEWIVVGHGSLFSGPGPLGPAPSRSFTRPQR
jgi:hypothetical protein